MKRLLFIFLSITLCHNILLAKEYVIDTTHTHVGFSIKHLMISNVKGDFKSYEADLEFDPEFNTFTKLVASIDTNSVDTGIQKRDDHLRSPDFFDAPAYPLMKFEMTEYLSGGKQGKMYGNLSIKNQMKVIKLDSTIHGVIKDFQGNERFGFTLEGVINRKDFGLEWNKILESGGLAVGDEVKLIIEVEAIEL